MVHMPTALMPCFEGGIPCLEKLYMVESEGKLLVIIHEGVQNRPIKENSTPKQGRNQEFISRWAVDNFI